MDNDEMVVPNNEVPGALNQLFAARCNFFFKVLRSDFLKTRCSTCFIRRPYWVRCNNCDWVVYCSELCRCMDFLRGHELECRFIDRFRTCLSHFTWEKDQQIATLRLFTLINSIQLRERQQNEDVDNLEHFNQLPSISILPPSPNIITSMVTALWDDINHVNTQTFTQLHARGFFNAIQIFDQGVVVGHGIAVHNVPVGRDGKPTFHCVMRNSCFELWNSPRGREDSLNFYKWGLAVLDTTLYARDLQLRGVVIKEWRNSFIYPHMYYFTTHNYRKITVLSRRFNDIMHDYFWRQGQKREATVIRLHLEMMLLFDLSEDDDIEFVSVQKANFALYASDMNYPPDDVENLRTEAYSLLCSAFGETHQITHRYHRYFYQIPYGNNRRCVQWRRNRRLNWQLPVIALGQ